MCWRLVMGGGGAWCGCGSHNFTTPLDIITGIRVHCFPISVVLHWGGQVNAGSRK